MHNQKNFLPVFWIFILALVSVASQSQQKTISLNRFFSQEIERSLLNDSASFAHTGIKPYLENRIDLKKIYGFSKDTTKIYNVAMGKLLKHHLFSVKKDDFFLAMDPVFDFTFGIDKADTSSYSNRNLLTNQRGLQLIGDIGGKFSFQTSFYETQTMAPLYLKQMADSTGIYPGFGRTKAFDVVGYDYAMANGWISYSPASWINLQFGQGKNFIGHGYRSIVLSDAAFSYPYIKATLSSPTNKLQYTSIYASLQSLDRLPKGEVPEALFKRKGASFHYLSWIPFPSIEVGLFEGIIWERYDSLGTRPQPYGAYLPVIGLNTMLNGFNQLQHVMTGINLKIRTTKHSCIYGQLATDGPAQKRIGYQAGVKYYDLILKNLDLQFEWNSVPEKMYSSHYPLQSYSHVNQPLGHPTGPATGEFLSIINYRYHRFIVQLKYNNIAHSLGPAGNWKSDPTVVFNNSEPWTAQTTNQFDCSAGFLFNPKTNLQFLIGYTNRTDHFNYNLMDDSIMQTSYYYVSIRTNLINRYSDF